MKVVQFNINNAFCFGSVFSKLFSAFRRWNKVLPEERERRYCPGSAMTRSGFTGETHLDDGEGGGGDDPTDEAAGVQTELQQQ